MKVLAEPNNAPTPLPETTLAGLPVGASGRIAGLHTEGLVRRRLLDLGFLPGTPIEVVRAAPFGDPRAYRLRGVTVALRRDDAAGIAIEPVAEVED